MVGSRIARRHLERCKRPAMPLDTSAAGFGSPAHVDHSRLWQGVRALLALVVAIGTSAAGRTRRPEPRALRHIATTAWRLSRATTRACPSHGESPTQPRLD